METEIKRISISSFQEINPFIKEKKTLCVTDFHGVLTQQISEDDSQTPNKEAIEFILKEKETSFIISSASSHPVWLHDQIINVFEKVYKGSFEIEKIEQSHSFHKSYFLKGKEKLLEIISVKEKTSSLYYKNKSHSLLYSDHSKNIKDFNTLIFIDDSDEILEKIIQNLPVILKECNEVQVILAHFIISSEKEFYDNPEILTEASSNVSKNGSSNASSNSSSNVSSNGSSNGSSNASSDVLSNGCIVLEIEKSLIKNRRKFSVI